MRGFRDPVLKKPELPPFNNEVLLLMFTVLPMPEV